MDMTYIIFHKRAPDKHPVWVETVEGLVKAKTRLQHYTESDKGASNGKYFVFDVQEGKIVNVLTKSTPA